MNSITSSNGKHNPSYELDITLGETQKKRQITTFTVLYTYSFTIMMNEKYMQQNKILSCAVSMTRGASSCLPLDFFFFGAVSRFRTGFHILTQWLYMRNTPLILFKNYGKYEVQNRTQRQQEWPAISEEVINRWGGGGGGRVGVVTDR